MRPLLALLLLAALLLAGCWRDAEGKRLILVREGALYEAYVQGAIETCLRLGREDMMRLRIPLTILNQVQLREKCLVETKLQFGRRFVPDAWPAEPKDIPRARPGWPGAL